MIASSRFHRGTEYFEPESFQIDKRLFAHACPRAHIVRYPAGEFYLISGRSWTVDRETLVELIVRKGFLTVREEITTVEMRNVKSSDYPELPKCPVQSVEIWT